MSYLCGTLRKCEGICISYLCGTLRQSMSVCIAYLCGTLRQCGSMYISYTDCICVYYGSICILCAGKCRSLPP